MATNETKVPANEKLDSTESNAIFKEQFENLFLRFKKMMNSKLLVHWVKSIERRTRQANDELEKYYLKLLTHDSSEDLNRSNHIDQIHTEGSSRTDAMTSEDINDDKEDSQSKPMSIDYEAASDISPEHLTSGELIDKTPAPLKKANKRYQQAQEDEEEDEIWKFCEEVNNKGTYGLTRHTSDADGSFTKKNKSLSDAEVKRRKKERKKNS
jgi:hypothetical protein